MNPGDLIILSFFSKMFNVVGFVGSEFRIFGGFGWVRSSVLVGKPGFGRVRSSSKFAIFGFDPALVLVRYICNNISNIMVRLIFEITNCRWYCKSKL